VNYNCGQFGGKHMPREPAGGCPAPARTDKTLNTIIHGAPMRGPPRCYKPSLSEVMMVKHCAISRSHVYQMLGSKDARVRRAVFRA
jgi:hypothetical protein